MLQVADIDFSRWRVKLLFSCIQDAKTSGATVIIVI